MIRFTNDQDVITLSSNSYPMNGLFNLTGLSVESDSMKVTIVSPFDFVPTITLTSPTGIVYTTSNLSIIPTWTKQVRNF
jgi:hypothetical protein